MSRGRKSSDRHWLASGSNLRSSEQSGCHHPSPSHPRQIAATATLCLPSSDTGCWVDSTNLMTALRLGCPGGPGLTLQKLTGCLAPVKHPSLLLFCRRCTESFPRKKQNKTLELCRQRRVAHLRSNEMPAPVCHMLNQP